MRQSLPRSREIFYCGKFKQAMWELCKNKNMSFARVEKALGFKDGFVESVEKGIHELTLEEVQKIAGYFHTTMDAVLDGGNVECRVCTRGVDELGRKQSADCLNAYAALLDDLAKAHWKSGLFEEEVHESKLRLERCQRVFVEHYKAYMEEFERENIQLKDAAGCCDEVLIRELEKRGFKVEKGGK